MFSYFLVLLTVRWKSKWGRELERSQILQQYHRWTLTPWWVIPPCMINDRYIIRGSLTHKISFNQIFNLLLLIVCIDIKPFVTLFHWDLPQAVKDEYSGFLSRRIVWVNKFYPLNISGHLFKYILLKHICLEMYIYSNDFQDYAEFCFKLFGNRVKYWPYWTSHIPIVTTVIQPGPLHRGDALLGQKNNCTGEDFGIEPYIVSHNLLLAHAAAVKLYKTKFQVPQISFSFFFIPILLISWEFYMTH